jgi:hypothetical protein
MYANAQAQLSHAAPMRCFDFALDVERASQRIASLEDRANAISGVIIDGPSVPLDERVDQCVAARLLTLHRLRRSVPLCGAAFDVGEEISDKAPFTILPPVHARRPDCDAEGGLSRLTENHNQRRKFEGKPAGRSASAHAFVPDFQARSFSPTPTNALGSTFDEDNPSDEQARNNAKRSAAGRGSPNGGTYKVETCVTTALPSLRKGSSCTFDAAIGNAAASYTITL